MTIDYDRLRELRDEATPGPWEVEQFEEQYAGCPPNTKFYLGSDDTQGIAVCEVSDRYYDQAKNNFEFIALAPDMARELLALRDGIKQAADELGASAEYAPNVPRQEAYLEAEQRLTDLLNGDTE